MLKIIVKVQNPILHLSNSFYPHIYYYCNLHNGKFLSTYVLINFNLFLSFKN